MESKLLKLADRPFSIRFRDMLILNSINQSAFKALEAWDHEEIKKLLEEMRDTILAICDREYGLDRLKILADAELNLFDEKNSN